MGQSDHPTRSRVLLRILFTLTWLRKEIHTPSNCAVRRVRRTRALGPTPTRANLTTRSNTNSLTDWLTSSHRQNEQQPHILRRQRLYTIQNQVTWFLISINTINIQIYVNNKRKWDCPTAHSPFLTAAQALNHIFNKSVTRHASTDDELCEFPGFITITTSEPCMISLDDDSTCERAKIPCGQVIGQKLQ